MTPDQVIATVVGDIALITAAAAVLGVLARRCGQPVVIGQILAGLLLGPVLLGRFPGHLVADLYPHQVLSSLTVLAQVAIVIFMFGVGYEISFHRLRAHGRTVPLVALGAFAVPMLAGSGAVTLFGGLFAGAAGPHGGGHSLMLFTGVALAITALPVLSAIIRDRGIAGTGPATVATTAAAVMDVLAWTILAAVIAGVGSISLRSVAIKLLLLGGWAAVLLVLVRPVAARLLARPVASLSYQVPCAIALAMTSACVTSLLGLHVFIGAFLAGLAMPRSGGRPDADVLRAMETGGGLLLPLFFAVTGLSLNVTSLNLRDLGLFAVLLTIACAGKLLPAYAGSRLGGLPRREASVVAALVNTRGLTELIALNAGLASGVISPNLFTVFVLVALVTTVATGPLLSLAGIRASAGERLEAVLADRPVSPAEAAQ